MKKEIKLKLEVELNSVKDKLPDDYQKVIIIGKNGMVQSAQYIKGLFECDDSEMYGTIGDHEVTDAIAFEVEYWIDQDDFSIASVLSVKEKRIDKIDTIRGACLLIATIATIVSIKFIGFDAAHIPAFGVAVIAFGIDTLLGFVHREEKKGLERWQKDLENS